MPMRRRSGQREGDTHGRQVRRRIQHVPLRTRQRPLRGPLQRPQERPLCAEVQALQGLLPTDVLRLIQSQLLRILHEEAQARHLAHRVQENRRRRSLRESQRAWDEAGFNRPIIRQGIGRACQCQLGAYQHYCFVQENCPMTGRPVRIHFAPGADRNTARLIYFGTGDEVYPNMYAISADEWDHDSGDKSDSSLTLY